MRQKMRLFLLLFVVGLFSQGVCAEKPVEKVEKKSEQKAETPEKVEKKESAEPKKANEKKPETKQEEKVKKVDEKKVDKKSAEKAADKAEKKKEQSAEKQKKVEKKEKEKVAVTKDSAVQESAVAKQEAKKAPKPEKKEEKKPKVVKDSTVQESAVAKQEKKKDSPKNAAVKKQDSVQKKVAEKPVAPAKKASKQKKENVAQKVVRKLDEKQRKVNDLLQKTAQNDGVTWYLFILAFIAGLLVSFTPCIYPMVPITMGVLQSQASVSVARNFVISLSYVLGIALVYASLGYFSATAGVMFGQWMANDWLVLGIAFIFLLLSLSMFGLYDIKLPSFLSNSQNMSAQGSPIKSFAIGMLSGTVTSPCLTPALAVLLTAVAQLGSPLAGFFLLFCFAVGMGSLLVVIGLFSNTMLPRAGEWMLDIKRFMGFMMLAVIVYYITPIIEQRFFGSSLEVVAWLYGLIVFAFGVYCIVQKSRSTLLFLLGLLTVLATLAAAGFHAYILFLL